MIRLDYRGRGQSDWSGAESYSIQREAQDAIELLDHLKIACTALLGTSRGGIIAMVLAATAKDRLSAVALNDIGYKGPLSVEWEDSRMDREHGATEAADFVRAVDFPSSALDFDAQFDN